METPRRNLKQELLVALVTLVILATAVSLAVVLTGDSLAAFRQTATPVALAPTTASLTSTVEPTQVTLTPTSSATRPAAASPTVSPTPSLTPGKPAPETSTSATPVAVKPSPIPPVTATPTTRPTRTPVPRITSIPTKGTPTATAMHLPTAMPSPTIAPTSTPIASPTEAATPWPTPLPPTPTIVLATPITPTVVVAGCTPPADWRPYTIRSGENLFRISLRAGVPLAEMQRVNCIPNAANIIAGQVIYVPPTFFYSTAPTSPIQAQETPSSIPRQVGCSVPGIQIAYPAPGAVLTSRFAVTGSATLEDSSRFSFYKVELRAENETVFHNVGQSNQPVTGGTLATIDPAAFGPGHYQLKLTVVDITGNYPQPCAIRVTFR